MELTPNLTLPYIMPSQAQKHVTHNEAIRMLDALVQISVIDEDLSAPPDTPSDGDRYIVADGASGDWSGRSGDIAAFQDGAWAFFAPRTGWLAWIADEARLIVHDGTGWSTVPVGSSGAALLGVNATADTTNRLAVCSPASLFEAEEGSHRLTISKQETSDTASVIFQTDHEGRAEIGLCGDDDLVMKVSQDGEDWVEALRVTGEGQVLLPPSTPASHPDHVVASRHIRERLTGNRTYYVRTDGDDGNNGLVNSSGGAFATVQKAFDVAYGELDLGTHNLTIQLGDGTYNQSAIIRGPHLGSGTITLAGNSSTPANTVLAGAASVATLTVENAATLFLRDLELRGANAALLWVTGYAAVRARGGMRFGSSGTANFQVQCADNATFDSFGHGYAIVGDSGRHFNIVDGGSVMIGSATIDVSGRAFSIAFVTAQRGARLRAPAVTFSGSATGKRFDVTTNGVIFTNAADTYLPGDVAGTTASGGMYA